MPKVKICDPSALGKGKSSIKPQTSIKPQMNTRKKKQLERPDRNKNYICFVWGFALVIKIR